MTLALVAVGTATAGDRKLYVVGGRELDREFLSTLVLPAGMRVLLYRNLDAGFAPSELIDAAGPAANPATLAPVDRAACSGSVARRSRIIGRGAAAETFHALPLPGLDNNVLGVLLIGSSRRDLVELESSLLRTGVIVAGAGILLGIRAELVGHRAHHAAGAAPGGKRRTEWPPATGAPPWMSSSADEIGNWRAPSIG